MTSPTKAAELADTSAVRAFAIQAGFAEAWVDADASPPHHPAPITLLMQFAALLRASEGRAPDGAAGVVEKALRRSFSLGQTYWQQADSDFVSQHKKSDYTLQRFDALCAETVAMLTDAPHPPAQQAEPGPDMVSREDFDKMSGDLTRAKRLIVDLAKQGDGRVRAMIEARTGTWFVWGQDRDAPPPHKAEGAEPPIVAVLWYSTLGRGGVSGQAVGADGSGEFAFIIRGDMNAADAWARDHVRSLEKAGHRFAHCSIVHAVPGYCGDFVQHITATTQEPSA